MYENEFYPTPGHVASQLVEGLNLRYKSILDPSAGQGDLLEVIDDMLPSYVRSPVYAIEINPELRAVLVKKGFKVVGTDFLTYPGLQYFDFIVMNPPFSEGVRHLLKAWDIANGATIRCLLNSETLNNCYTEDRRRLFSIIEQYGWTKELGPVFKTAERKTSINVVMIHLEDTRSKEAFRLDFDPETISTGDFQLEDAMENEVALADIFENYEARFRATIEAFKELLAARQKVEHYLAPLVKDFPSPRGLIGDALADDKKADISYQDFLEAATRAAWDHLFSKTKLGSVTTESVRREIEALQTQQGMIAFIAANMEDLFNTLFHNREHIMIKCVLEMFDEMTRHYDKNREYHEGWKTNSSYMVARRFILPGVGSYYSSGLDYRAEHRIEDIEKALCFLDGKRFEDIVSVVSRYGRDSRYGQWTESEFFKTKLFKKRTMHFYWLDEALRQNFNAVVARERWGELPEKTKAGVYK